MIRKSGYRFSLGTNAKRLPGDHARTIKIERDDDSKKSHPALPCEQTRHTGKYQIFVETCKGLGVGDPGMTRTCDLRFRKPSLYPAELRDRLDIASELLKSTGFRYDFAPLRKPPQLSF